MINLIVDDINKALDNDAYFAALSLALTLPDICGKAEYPNANVGKRYIDWYDEYVGKYEQCPCENCQEMITPYLSGEVIYNFRNSFLHQGTPNIDNRKIKDDTNKINEFTLVIEKKNEFDIYADTSSVGTTFAGTPDTDIERTYSVNVRRLCLILTLSAKSYYAENKDKFNFFHFNIMDWDKEVSKIRQLKE